jgi:hypothetical protein
LRKHTHTHTGTHTHIHRHTYTHTQAHIHTSTSQSSRHSPEVIVSQATTVRTRRQEASPFGRRGWSKPARGQHSSKYTHTHTHIPADRSRRIRRGKEGCASSCCGSAHAQARMDNPRGTTQRMRESNSKCYGWGDLTQVCHFTVSGFSEQ